MHKLGSQKKIQPSRLDLRILFEIRNTLFQPAFVFGHIGIVAAGGRFGI